MNNPKRRIFRRDLIGVASGTTMLLLVLAGVSACSRTGGSGSGSEEEGAVVEVSFIEDVKTFFEQQCLGCHNAGALMGRFNLETKDMAFGSDDGSTFIVPGKPEESKVYIALNLPHGEDAAMPPEGHRIAKDKVKLVHDWIAQGAPWPEGMDGVLVPMDPSQ